jgi:mono/diheme cytochrome c family protein
MSEIRKAVYIAAAALFAAALLAGTSETQAADSATRAFLTQYCVSCHNNKARTAGVSFEGLDPTDPAKSAGAPWERVLLKLRAGEMPPPAHQPRPNSSAVSRFTETLRETLDRAAAAQPDPGRPVIHRLNRAEYHNAIKDLVAVDIDVQSQLPADDSGYGFDNIADVLSLSPALFERYLAVSETVARLAVAEPGSGKESRSKIFLCQPSASLEADTCAREILSNLARRAYRRPAKTEEIVALMTLYRTRAPSFERGIQLALEAMLVSPNFLFRIERDPPGNATVYRVSDIELASRLSFFLWSSIPDGELLNLAEQNQLHEPAILDKQIRRMIADPRSSGLTENFAGQWLYLRNLDLVKPDPDIFPAFDEGLRQSLKTETEMFFRAMFVENRSVLDFLGANFTFLNERLARHYGIAGVLGPEFRRVTLKDPYRGGLLGQASILTVTSYPNRTSIVQRGKWILENLLGSPPPPPPPDIPDLKPQGRSGAASLRAAMEEHRSSPTCAACHARMDPLGFALENYDATGAWRMRDNGVDIDPKGKLPDGTALDGPAGVRKALMARREEFIETFVEKLLTYAIGRGLEPSDRPAVRAIAREVAKDNNRMMTVVTAIVKSAPFQMRRRSES